MLNNMKRKRPAIYFLEITGNVIWLVNWSVFGVGLWISAEKNASIALRFVSVLLFLLGWFPMLLMLYGYFFGRHQIRKNEDH